MPDNTTLQSSTLATAPAGLVIAGDDVGSVFYQRTKRSVGADGAVTDFLDKTTRSDTFTTASVNGTVVDISAQGMSKFALQVKQTGTVTSWDVRLMGSLDGTNYIEILRHVKTTTGSETVAGDGAIAFTGANHYPLLYFRSRCEAITLGGGTNVIATIVGVP